MSALDYNRSNDIELICSDIVSMKVVYGAIQKHDLIYKNYIDVDPMPLKGYAKFPNLSTKSKFKSGDKVKIIKDYTMNIKGELVNFKGFEGIVYSSLNLVSGMYNQNIVNCSYDVDINGFVVAGINESALELIEQPKKIEYRKDLYDIADDIDGCLLPDYQPKSELIQRKIS